MGYVANATLSSLFDPERLDDLFRRITLRCGHWLLDRVTELSPVAEDPYGEHGRPPGTLRESWSLGEIVVSGNVYRVEVGSSDPVSVYVEYGTRPHVIFPKGMVLRFRDRSGRVIYARSVRHPGTKPVRMMGRALAELRLEWARIAREEMARDR
jgi:hypothetical protein